MTGWYLVLAPLAVLAVLVLFRFIGCASLLDIQDVSYVPGPSGPDYAKTVLSDNPVSYWRLQEKQGSQPPSPTVPNTPVSGGTAKDEKGNNDGTYKAAVVQPGPQFPDSPSAPLPPGGPSLALEAPGLLELTGQQSTSLQIDGGYVEVPFSNSLLLKSFTVEALVRPEWGVQEVGLFRTVIALNTVAVPPAPAKAFGFGIFAGPAPGGSTGPDVWQVWVADGTAWKPVQDPNRSLTPVDFTKTNYVAVTYDDTTKTLNMYVYVRGVDLSSDLAHPVKDLQNVTFSPVTDPGQSLLIGMHRPPVGSTLPVYHPFKGKIQEVAVYDKALTIGRCPVSHVCAGLNL